MGNYPRWQRLRKWLHLDKPFVPTCQAETQLAGIPVYSAIGGLAICREKPDIHHVAYIVKATDMRDEWRKKYEDYMRNIQWDIVKIVKGEHQ